MEEAVAESSISQLRPNMNIERAIYDGIRGQVERASQRFVDSGDQTRSQIERVLDRLNSQGFDETADRVGRPRIRPELCQLVKLCMRYNWQLPSTTPQSYSVFLDADQYRRSNTSTIIAWEALNQYNHPTFEQSPEFKDLWLLYDGLDIELKLCLLCFSVFPENVIIRRRVMVYWWIGEGFAPPIVRDRRTAEELANGKTAEEYANDYFKKLMAKGFIEPVYEMHHKLAVGSCKMHPFIRSAVIMFAKSANFFSFDCMGKPTAHDSYRACLCGKGFHSSIVNLDKLHMLFNLNECILNFEPIRFYKMKNINVLYLGRWQASATHHIEVEETELSLAGLENMNYLRFLSLQGISKITRLPHGVSKLVNLVILDLRDCHDLVELPERISSLKNLTHLDMSGCYRLEYMPKGLALLSKLQVLKGFVIGRSKRGNHCTLEGLAARLHKLRKFNIRALKEDFPSDRELNALRQLGALRKLTIDWEVESGIAKSKAAATTNSDGVVLAMEITINKIQSKLCHFRQHNMPIPLFAELPVQLEKLDLRCFPEKTLPKWLMPSHLKSLKKLCIRGGKLQDLGHIQEVLDDNGRLALGEKQKWTVKSLCLKYLRELDMDWRELRDLFPDIIFLEKVKCPKLTFFPCNERGVWRSRAMG
ncbi:Disease resistance RPP13-like protein 4 [Camellia lanceoleosa]|uniref:Disease resistance RPP13-like protein 4 n=1 Tax=Camellia lanceoleosa TaxID=1840588 RepID=A0ACC0GIX0_9ERIC|nr:Disease resistance RPP13-like protein 4 [Camellia lanceoleosa]